MTGSRVDAEDVCQEVWLRWRRVTRPLDNPTGYLVTIARNLAISEARRSGRDVLRGETCSATLASPDRGGHPDAKLQDAASLAAVFEVLFEHPSMRARLVIVLHDVFECTYREIARELGGTEEAIRQTACRARATLRRSVGERRTAGDRGDAEIDKLVDASLIGDVGRAVQILRDHERRDRASRDELRCENEPANERNECS